MMDFRTLNGDLGNCSSNLNSKTEGIYTMHEITYNSLDESVNRKKALEDLAAYMGSDKLDKVTEEIAKEYPTPSPENFFMVAHAFGILLGVIGYPVIALMGNIWKLSDAEIRELTFNTDHQIDIVTSVDKTEIMQ